MQSTKRHHHFIIGDDPITSYTRFLPLIYLCPGPWEADLSGFPLCLPSQRPQEGSEGGRKRVRVFVLLLPPQVVVTGHVCEGRSTCPPCLSPDAGNCPLLVSLHLLKLLQIVPLLNSLQITKLHEPLLPAGSLVTPEIMRKVTFSPFVASYLHKSVSYVVA